MNPIDIGFFDEYTQLKLEFEPFGSYIIVFSEDLPAKEAEVCRKAVCSREEDISRGWTLHVEGLFERHPMERLQTWEVFPELKYYSGGGWYEKTVFLEEDMKSFDGILLSFDNVYETAEVFVNGQSAGTLWKSPRELDISKVLRPGKNELAIKVVNLWINDAINPEKSEQLCPGTVIEEWPYFSDIINNFKKRRLFNWREREFVKQPLKSGIEGTVRLKFMNKA